MTPLDNQEKAEELAGLYQELEAQIMANIAKHCRDYDQPIASDRWLLKKMAEVGSLNRENVKLIANYAGLSQTALERMLLESSQEALEEVEPALRSLVRLGLTGTVVRPEKSWNVHQVMEKLQAQAKDTLNLCNTTMLYKAKDAYKMLVRKICSDAEEITGRQWFLDKLGTHATAVTIGVESRQAAVRKCIQEFNEKGIPAFVDKRGREWTPEAYVNMAMRNTAKSVADEVQTARCRDCGVHLVEIDSHPGARPKCARDQGKIFDLDNGSGYVEDAAGKKIHYHPWNSSSYGEPDGLLGINCSHHKYPFWPGMSLQSYFPVDLEENDRLYKQTQIQRALERSVRAKKRECMLYDQIGDREAFEKSAVQLKQKEAKLKGYVDGNPKLHRKKDREQVVGFDRRISAEAVGANKKVQKFLAEKARNDKIKAEIKSIGMQGEIELFPTVKLDVSDFSFDDAHINQERNHKVTREDAERLIQEADISFAKWNGRFVNYYGENGAVFVDQEKRNIRTSFWKEEYDDRVKAMREVLREHGQS